MLPWQPLSRVPPSTWRRWASFVVSTLCATALSLSSPVGFRSGAWKVNLGIYPLGNQPIKSLPQLIWAFHFPDMTQNGKQKWLSLICCEKYTYHLSSSACLMWDNCPFPEKVPGLSQSQPMGNVLACGMHSSYSYILGNVYMTSHHTTCIQGLTVVGCWPLAFHISWLRQHEMLRYHTITDSSRICRIGWEI